MLISFSGIDGSGKSTLTDKLVMHLEEAGVKVSKLEVYNLSIFLNIGKLLGKLSGDAKERMEKDMYTSGKREKMSFIKILRVACFFLDTLFFYIRLLILKASSKSAVCDRYLYDTLIHLRYLKAVGGGVYRFLLKCIPRPDASFVLSLDASSAMGREIAHDEINYYIEKAALYKSLSEETSSIVIDSSNDTETVWEKVKGIIDTRFI